MILSPVPAYARPSSTPLFATAQSLDLRWAGRMPA
jgi:hypothetical protein